MKTLVCALVLFLALNVANVASATGCGFGFAQQVVVPQQVIVPQSTAFFSDGNVSFFSQPAFVAQPAFVNVAPVVNQIVRVRNRRNVSSVRVRNSVAPIAAPVVVGGSTLFIR